MPKQKQAKEKEKTAGNLLLVNNGKEDGLIQTEMKMGRGGGAKSWIGK